MARPRKKDSEKKKRTELTLTPKIKLNAAALAFEQGESLSEMVDRLLGVELASKGAKKTGK